MMNTDVARNMLNQELIRIYKDIDFDEKEYKKLMKMSIKTVHERKDVKNALKLAEKYEKTHNLVNTNQNTPKNQYNAQVNFNQYRAETTKTDENQAIEQPNGEASDTETDKE